MLFISILLSIWFGLWLWKTVFIKDSLSLITSWLIETYDEEDEDGILDNFNSRPMYNLSCDKCNHTWISTDQEVNYCPNCGAKRNGH